MIGNRETNAVLALLFAGVVVIASVTVGHSRGDALEIERHRAVVLDLFHHYLQELSELHESSQAHLLSGISRYRDDYDTALALLDGRVPFDDDLHDGDSSRGVDADAQRLSMIDRLARLAQGAGWALRLPELQRLVDEVVNRQQEALALVAADAPAGQRERALALVQDPAHLARIDTAKDAVVEIRRAVIAQTEHDADAAEQRLSRGLAVIVIAGMLLGVFAIRAWVLGREAAAKLRKAKLFSDKLLDTMANVVVVLDRDGNIQRFNAAAQQLTGFSAEEVLGGPIWDPLIPPEIRADVRAVFEDLVHDRLVGRFENEWMTKDGGRRLFAWHNAVLHDADGLVSHVVAIGDDITEKRVVERRLDAQRRDLEAQVEARTSDIAATLRRLELAARVGGLGIFDWDVRSGEVHWDDALFEMYGIGERDRINPNDYAFWRERVHPDDVGRAEQSIERMLAGDGDYAAEFRVSRSDGEVVDLRATAYVERDASGAPTHVIGVNWDVTERNRKDAALRKHRDFVQSVLDSIPSHIAVLDTNGNIVAVNAAWRHFGKANGAADDAAQARTGVGANYLAACADPAADLAEQTSRCREALLGVLAGRAPSFTMEYPCASPTQENWYLMTASPLPGGEGAVVVHTDVTERVLHERSLRAVLERLALTQRAMDQAGIGVTWNDMQTGRFMYASDAALRVLGYTREQLLQLTVPDIASQWRREAFDPMMEQLRDKGVAQVEAEIRTADGDLVPTEVLLYYQSSNQESQEHHVAFVRDISERRHAEAEIQRLLDILANSTDAIVAVDLDQRFTYVNPAGRRLFGLSDDLDVTAVSAADVVPPGVMQRIEAEIVPALYRDGHWQGEGDALRADGLLIPVSVVAALHRDDAGKPQGYSGVIRDIRERKASEEVLRDREAFYRGLFDKAPLAYQSLDLEGRFVEVNGAWMEMFGCRDKREVIGRDFGDVLAECSRPQMQQTFARFKTDAVVASPPFTARRLDNGDEFLIKVDGRVDSEPARDYFRTHCLLTNVSEQMRVEQELRAAIESADAANRAKSAFLATMSHEIRTPLHATIGLLQLMSVTSDRERLRDYIDKAYRAAESLLFLLNDILDFSSIEAGRLELDETGFSLKRKLDGVRGVLARDATQKGLVLTVAADPACPDRLRGDPVRLFEVLLNLGSNAVKFTRHGQVDIRVAVETWARRGSARPSVVLRFSVRDTGIGIAPEQLAQVFDWFSQGDSSTRREFGGSGLGLAITRELVELMGGTISVDSTLGRGSEFRVVLPFELEEAAATPSHALPAPAAHAPLIALDSLTGVHVLAVEDDALSREVLAAQLTLMGAGMDTAQDGAGAIDAVARAARPYDLVIMDLHMPGMDGIEATRRLREAHSATDLPIVGLTADVQPATRAACIDAGMNEVLSKPISVEVLREVVGRVAGHRIIAGTDTDPAPTVPAPAAAARLGKPVGSEPAGFDLVATIDRLGGSTATYAGLLRRFLDTVATTHAGLNTLLTDPASDGVEQAARVLHRLRGSALSLGAVSWAATLHDAEVALSTQPAVDRQVLAAELDVAAAESLATLRDILAQIEEETHDQ